jgi:hypothetical protein
MRIKTLISLWCTIFFFVSCSSSLPTESSLWKTDRLRNGSVTYYSTTNDKGKIIGNEWNHIFYEAGSLVIVREIVGSEEEQLLRIKMDKASLMPLFLEITSSENTEQTLLYQGKKKNRAYFVENNTATPKQHKQFYLGKGTLIEQEVLVFLMASYPFAELSRINLRTINTRKALESELSVEYRKIESIQMEGIDVEAYRLDYPSFGITAWYMIDAPHLLLRSKQGANTTDLINWNGI